MLKLIKRPFKLKDGSSSWSYQIAGTDPRTGQPVRVGTRTRDKKVAEDRLTLELDKRRDLALNGQRPQHTFAAAVVEYGAKGGEARYLEPLVRHFGKRKLGEIKDTDLSEFAAIQFPGAKASTLVRQVYGPMQWVWNAAVRAQMCQPREFAKPEIKREPVKYARSDEWLFAVLRACTELRQRCALLFMSFSGSRASEVVNIRVCDYSAGKAEIIIRTKGGKERVVPLSPLVNEALQCLLALEPDRHPEAKLMGYASRYSLNRILKRACKRAGVEHLSPHKAGRHTFAARLLRDGASLKELQEAGGWDDIGVVARSYAHLERSAVDARVRGVATTIAAEAVTMDYTMKDGTVRPLQTTQSNQRAA